MIRPYAATYECGRQLFAAGIPLDYEQNLPRESNAHRSRLYFRGQIGYAESLVFDFGLTTGYVLVFAIGTDLPSGNIISQWSFAAPWEHRICWDYEAADFIAQWKEIYPQLFNSRLSAVLNDRCLLRRGRRVEGILCGYALEPIPECFSTASMVSAQLGFTDDLGRTSTFRMVLAVDRSRAPKRAGIPPKHTGGISGKRDVAFRLSKCTAADSDLDDRNSVRIPAVPGH